MCSNAQGHYKSSSAEGLSSAESASCNALLWAVNGTTISPSLYQYRVKTNGAWCSWGECTMEQFIVYGDKDSMNTYRNGGYRTPELNFAFSAKDMLRDYEVRCFYSRHP